MKADISSNNSEFNTAVPSGSNRVEQGTPGIANKADDPAGAEYMRRAIKLALKGTGFTGPNPLVGAVIVKDGRIIGEGWHEHYAELHAERNALAHCSEDPAGATIYVTLEPCCHHGKQPPCTEALIEAGIAEVYVGSPDPNPLVAGKGIEILRAAGIRVVTGFLQAECDAINKIFFHYITNDLPFVTLKYAMTLDGKIASASGKSKWISSAESRRYVHELRKEHMSIMAGVGTVLADDPLLNVRLTSGESTTYGSAICNTEKTEDGAADTLSLRTSAYSPVRVICDTDLRTPLDSQVVRTAAAGSGSYRAWLPRTIIATCVSDPERLKPYQDLGVHIMTVEKDEHAHASMLEIIKRLGEMKIDSVLVEGGASINWSVLASGTACHAACFIAPMIMGGETAKSPVAGMGFDSPADACRLTNVTIRPIGEDTLIEGDIKSPDQPIGA